MIKYLFYISLFFILAACASQVPKDHELRPPPIAEQPMVPVEPLLPVSWDEIDGWYVDSTSAALAVFQQGCRSLIKRERWQRVCVAALVLEPQGEDSARNFFEAYFQPYQVRNQDGSVEGLITGYYGPELSGSRFPTETFRYPLYAQPDDLLIIDLDEVYPELNNYRLRGRVVGNRVVPYFERGEIDGNMSMLSGHEIFWVENPVDLFFLHIQGSGRIRLPDGELVMVNYANQNGHPYRSIGKLLLERDAMTRDQMSMQNIRRWVENNPEEGKKLLAENPSYVFFRELPADYTSPPGAMGVPLTAQRSLAVDPRTIPLGSPVFLATTFPGSEQPLQRLMVAQDTGGAIKGQVRADFFWGMGHEAGALAGRMKQAGQLWVLLPKQVDEEGLQSLFETESASTSEVN